MTQVRAFPSQLGKEPCFQGTKIPSNFPYAYQMQEQPSFISFHHENGYQAWDFML